MLLRLFFGNLCTVLCTVVNNTLSRDKQPMPLSSLQSLYPSPGPESPFDMSSDSAYLDWREDKLRYRVPVLKDVLVDINDPYQLTDAEKAAIIEHCQHYNLALHQ